MTNKENINIKLKELSIKMDVEKDYGVTANDIAQCLGIQRNIVSHLLNKLNKEGLAIKINTRPVYFIHQEIYEERKSKMKLVSKYLDSNTKDTGDNEAFKNLVGFDGSLKYVVDQCKSAVLYPTNGLTILLVGSSGVGKSLLAQTIFEYARSENVIVKNSPFIIFNCAEYANNPELLSATLFGSIKGAYTGADRDKAGLIEEADGGFLFLDEIHRLSPEGQEKLFLFLDKGVFRSVGESGGWRRAEVRMIFATTENPKNSFLQTFLRRIPLIVNIPDLQERPLNEKLELIYNIYKKEAINIKKDILVSNQVINILIKNKDSGNIGKLTNAIKLSCANAFSNSNEKQVNVFTIKVNNLPKEFVDGFDGIILNNVNLRDIVVSCSDKEQPNAFKNNFKKTSDLTDKMINKIKEMKNKQISYSEFIKSSLFILNELIDDIVFNEVNKKTNTVIFKSIKTVVENILTYLQSDFSIKHYGNSVEIITFLLIYFMEYDGESTNVDIDEIISYLRKSYSKEYKIVSNLVNIVETNLNMTLNKLAIIYILIYIKSFNRESNLDQINAIIIAHGYTTASSIAGVSNRMIGQYVFEAFDMPLEISNTEICKKLNSYIDTIDTTKGLIILVDMGSLENIYKEIHKDFYGDIAIINNISTKLALDVGNRIVNYQSIQQIAKEAVEKNVCSFDYIPSKNKKKDAIITTCFTGIGTAKKMKDLLERCFSNEKVKVIAYDYEKLKGNGREDYVFKQYNIKLIIGTSDPKIEEVPYISLESMIMRKGDVILTNSLSNIVDAVVIDKINIEIIKLFTLENVVNYLTILNPDKIIDQVQQALHNLEIGLGFKFKNDLKIGLYIHICCMIERLVIKDPIMTYNKSLELEQCHIQFITLVRNAFSVIEQFYKVNIPISEIGFIYDSIKNKIEDFSL